MDKPHVTAIQDAVRQECIENELNHLRQFTEKLGRNLVQSIETNRALLRFLVRQDQAEKGSAEPLVGSETQALVTSYLNKMRKRIHDPQALIYLEIVEKTLGGDSSPLRKSLAAQGPNFTNTEMEVACMVRRNLSSKEIADALNVSDKTVASHRQKIRQKLGITNKKVSLNAYLANL